MTDVAVEAVAIAAGVVGALVVLAYLLWSRRT